MQQNKPNQNEENEIICRKSNIIYFLLWIAFVIVLFMMFVCMFSLDLWTMWNNSLLQFFFLVELIIAIVAFEEYVNILIIWKDWIRIESWIIVKDKKEIPYDKINSMNIHSAFGLWSLEIMTWNDKITRYKFMDKYEEMWNIIKNRINKDKK